MPRPIALVVSIAVATVLPGAVASARIARYCRRHCGDAIAACVQVGGHRASCRRATLRQCTGDRTVCTPSPFPTTSTTTTLPRSGGVGLIASNVETRYEIGFSVPAPGAEFVTLDVTIRNGSGFGNVFPTSLVLHADGLDYAAFSPYFTGYPSGGVAGACDYLTSVAPGGELTCALVYQVRETVATARLSLGPYQVSGVSVIAPDFAVPSVPRPTATLAIGSVIEVASFGFCSPRDGFKILAFPLTLTSDGASGLALDLYRVILDADNARYTSGCGYGSADPCDGSIGVPVDGASSCTAAFQVRDTVTAGTLEYDDGRYRTSAEFTLD